MGIRINTDEWKIILIVHRDVGEIRKNGLAYWLSKNKNLRRLINNSKDHLIIFI